MGVYKEARTPTVRGKRLHHLEIHPSDEGITVRHVYHEDGMSFHKPKDYEFGKDETDDLVQHLGKHAGLPVHQVAEAVTEEGEG